jgi:hypothetical protein
MDSVKVISRARSPEETNRRLDDDCGSDSIVAAGVEIAERCTSYRARNHASYESRK